MNHLDDIGIRMFNVGPHFKVFPTGRHSVPDPEDYRAMAIGDQTYIQAF